MSKQQWKLLDKWLVEDKSRMVFRPQQPGTNLIDITLETDKATEVIEEVVTRFWTTNELIEYLNSKSDFYEH